MQNISPNIIYNIIRQGQIYIGMRWRGISPDGQYIFQGNRDNKCYGFWEGDGSRFIEIGDI